MEKLDYEMTKYSECMKVYLPIEERVKELKRSGLSYDEIRRQIGDDFFDYVPKTLYHGSPYCLDVINSFESTQSGSVVYATDNPMHALFFSIFRNSSQVRAHIDERIDENGEYKVEYVIDERYEGALEETLDNKEVTIHVCDGKDFYKPHGEQYIGREWISEEGKTIIPTDRITVNPKEILEELHNKGLLHIDRYDKRKDWITIIDMISMNYPFGLTTTRYNNNPDEFEHLYDEYIEKHFPDKLEFSKSFRSYARDVMFGDGDLKDKLKTIREKGRSFLTGNEPNMEEINEFCSLDEHKTR